MLPGKRLIAAGAAALIAGLIITFPATVAYQYFAPPGLTLSGLSGTIWQGRAMQGNLYGLFFEKLDWRFHPLSLFVLKPRYSISTTPAGGFLQSEVAVTPGGHLRFSDLAASLPSNALQLLLPMPGLEGELGLQFDQLVLDDGFPVAADGTISISKLTVPPISSAALGDFRAVLRSDGDRIIGEVNDLSGMLDVAGEIVLFPDRSYRLVGQVAPAAEAPDALVRQLRFLGSPDEEGRREFRFEGQLP